MRYGALATLIVALLAAIVIGGYQLADYVPLLVVP